MGYLEDEEEVEVEEEDRNERKEGRRGMTETLKRRKMKERIVRSFSTFTSRISLIREIEWRQGGRETVSGCRVELKRIYGCLGKRRKESSTEEFNSENNPGQGVKINSLTKKLRALSLTSVLERRRGDRRRPRCGRGKR